MPGIARSLHAQALTSLEVASAGSIGPMLNGPVKRAIAQSLQLDLHGHALGADAVAKAIIEGTLRPDMFIPITSNPMLAVMRSGKAQVARPIAQTEMVLMYSRKSRFLSGFEAAAEGKANWWEILQEPSLRLARSDPSADPSGRNIIFVMMLAAKKYGQANLVEKILGPTLKPKEMLAGGNSQAMLQRGEIDAVVSYRVSPAFSDLPYLVLPSDINLSGLHVRAQHPEVSLNLGDKTFHPEPLVFYASVLTGATHSKAASDFLNWLCGPDGQTLLRQYHFDPAADVADLQA